MSAHLIFLFLFQSGLAFAFSYFITRILLGGNEGSSRESMLTGIRKIRLVVAAFTVILPLAMFFAYMKSLPEGKSLSLAVWPAVWIFMILAAVILALTMAMRSKPAGPSEP
ncbi:MAG: hypothetical protein AB3N33_08235 [Puniceicoccaceae bacterium]